MSRQLGGEFLFVRASMPNDMASFTAGVRYGEEELPTFEQLGAQTLSAIDHFIAGQPRLGLEQPSRITTGMPFVTIEEVPADQVNALAKVVYNWPQIFNGAVHLRIDSIRTPGQPDPHEMSAMPSPQAPQVRTVFDNPAAA